MAPTAAGSEERTEDVDFDTVIDDRFPGAIDEGLFVERCSGLLARHGFVPGATLAIVGLCRDEITGSLRRSVEATWGPSFDLSGLAGMVFAGRTGLAAALAHVPVVDGRTRAVLFAMAHIGIGADGTIGTVHRAGIDEASVACGALQGFLGELQAGRARADADPLDPEQSLIRQRLGRALADGAHPDLVEVTRLALDCIEQDLAALFAGVPETGSATTPGRDGALFTGIQIHGPGTRNLVWPSRSIVEVDGEATAVVLD